MAIIGELMQLEERIVLDGAVAPAGESGAETSLETLAAAPAGTENQALSIETPALGQTPANAASAAAQTGCPADLAQAIDNLYVIDSSVETAAVAELTEQLADAKSAVVRLETGQTLDDLSAIIEDFADLQSINLLAEGNAGMFALAGKRIDAEFVTANAEIFAAWAAALDEGGDFTVYSCYSGLGARGEMLGEALAAATGAAVGLSTNATGNALFADWTLEYTIGAVQNATLNITDTNLKLATLTLPANTWQTGETTGVSGTGDDMDLTDLSNYYVEAIQFDINNDSADETCYVINSLDDLIWLSTAETALGNGNSVAGLKSARHYIIACDLDFTAGGTVAAAQVDWNGSGAIDSGDDAGYASFVAGAAFQNSILDGQNHTITGLYINSAADNTGFIGVLNTGTVRDLTFDQAEVRSANPQTGILAGNVTNNGSVINCAITNSVVLGANNTGGLVGLVQTNNFTVDGVTLHNVYVQGGQNVGGLIGSFNVNNADVINTITDVKFNNVGVKATTAMAGGLIGNVTVAGDSATQRTRALSINQVEINQLAVDAAGNGAGGIIGNINFFNNSNTGKFKFALDISNVAINTGKTGDFSQTLNGAEYTLAYGSKSGSFSAGGIIGKLSSSNIDKAATIDLDLDLLNCSVENSLIAATVAPVD